MSIHSENNSRFISSFSGTSITQKSIKDYRYEVTGELFQIDEIQDFSGGFSIRKFVIMDESSYPSPICFDLLKADVNKIDRFDIGDRVRVVFKLRGRQWNGKYFSNLHAVKVELLNDNKSLCEDEDIPF